jgi:hypothetical protein
MEREIDGFVTEDWRTESSGGRRVKRMASGTAAQERRRLCLINGRRMTSRGRQDVEWEATWTKSMRIVTEVGDWREYNGLMMGLEDEEASASTSTSTQRSTS